MYLINVGFLLNTVECVLEGAEPSAMAGHRVPAWWHQLRSGGGDAEGIQWDRDLVARVVGGISGGFGKERSSQTSQLERSSLSGPPQQRSPRGGGGLG